MKKQQAVHQGGFVSLVRNKQQQFKSKIYSCGTGQDDSIGIWSFKDDYFYDDRTVINTKEHCTGALACYGNDMFIAMKHKNKQNVTQYTLFRYVLNGDNTIDSSQQISTFTEKILAVDVSSNGIYVVAGSGDHWFKCLRLDDTSLKYRQTKEFELNGAIVFISIDPTSTNYTVSSSDGLVSVFAIEDIDSEVDILATAEYNICDSFKPEDGQARLRVCWNPTGSELFIPAKGHIRIISTEDWNEKNRLHYSKAPLDLFGSVVHCQNLVCAVNNRDKLVCFDLITLKVAHEESIEVEVLRKDMEGPFVSSTAFIEDGFLAIGAKTGDIYKHRYEILPSDAIMNEDESSVAKLKSQYSINYNPDEPLRFNDRSDHPTPVYDSKPAILIEKARTREMLVPGLTKESNDFICLKYNGYGYVFDRVVDGERSIEIKFHDVSVHSDIILDNQSSHFIFADLNNSILALASQKGLKDESELYVRQINSWDRDNQIWSATMPSGETIEALSVGQNFVVIYTDLRFVRIYTETGNLRFIFSSQGPLRSLVAGGNSLCLVRDTGGLIIDDSDDYYERRYVLDLYKVSPLSSNVLTTWHKAASLALSPGTDLNWIGFTPAGNLCSMDGLFVVRYLTPGCVWIPVFVGADVLKNPAGDAIWPTSLSERPLPKFRYFYCRGRDRPNFQKTEVPITAEWNLPVDNKESEKGKYESELLLNELVQSIACDPHSGFLNVEKQVLMKEYTKSIAMLFGLWCKKEKDARALEVANLTDKHNLGLLRTFAAKQNRLTLTNKIEELFNEKSAIEHRAPRMMIAQAPQPRNVSPQSEKRIQLQKKRPQASITTSLVKSSSLDTSLQANDSLLSGLTPARIQNPLPDVLNTQDSLISLSTTPMIAERKRGVESVDGAQTTGSKKQRTNDDFFDSLE